MATSDWLSIEEISRLWSEETGLDASAFQRDLEEWFAAFIKQSPSSQSIISGTSVDNTNRLMGMLGARFLERTTFEAFCRERGYPKPGFWSRGRGDDSWAARPDPSELLPSGRGAKAPRLGDAKSRGGDVPDSELAAFQTQVARLSERLKTPEFDFPSFSKPATSDEADRTDQSEPSEASPEADQRERAGEALPESADTEDLKTQLAAAEQRIAALTAELVTHRIAAPQSLSPDGGPADPRPFAAPRPYSPTSYRDPNASSELLRSRGRRRRGAGRFALVGTLAMLLVVLAVWGIDTAMQLAGQPQALPPGKTADSTAGPGAADRGLPPSEPTLVTSAGIQSSPSAPVAGLAGKTPSPVSDELGPAGLTAPSAGAAPISVGSDLRAAQRQIARLSNEVEASDAMVARLQDELAIARQALETERQGNPAGGASDTRERHLASQALSAEVAMARRELKAARQKAAADAETRRPGPGAASSEELETFKNSLHAQQEKVAALTEALKAASAEASRLHTALDQADQRAAQADSQRLAAETAAAEARTNLANAEQKLAARGERLAAARAEASRLQEAMQQAAAQDEAKRRELSLGTTAASAQAAALQRKLEAAYLRIESLNQTVASAEKEVVSLREKLAAQQGETTSDPAAQQQQEATSSQPPAPPPDETRALESLGVRAGPSGQNSGLNGDEGASPPGEGTGAAPQEPLTEGTAPAETQQPRAQSAEPDTEELLSAAEPAPPSVTGPAAPAGGQADGAANLGPGGAEEPAGAAATTAPASAAPLPDPANSLAQVAALDSAAKESETDAIGDTITTDDLLLAPGSHVGREVVVTGTVVWLLWRYRLQSDSGPSSIVIDVAGLQPAERQRLKDAMTKVGFMGEVRARIRGTIEREAASSFHLAASELVVIE